MAENTIHSLTSTLTSTQSLPLSEQHVASSQPTNTESVSPIQPVQFPHQAPIDANAPPVPLNGAPNGTAIVLNPDGTTTEAPVKRRPGRPKGSGKKQLDPSAEPKVKRPVGRPRKDGLPAGSVGPRRAARPRKRPPGSFASVSQSVSASAVFPYPSPFNFVSSEPTQTQWRASMPPMGSLSRGRPPAQLAFPIDPSLDRDNWAELSRTRPDVFLQTLVSALTMPNPISAGGPTVEEAFKSHLISLAPASKNTPSIPTLYSILKTFWLPSSPVYFSLTASASTARTPSDHRFLYWDPQPLVFNGIACPACSAPLINRGRISSGPIKVYDLGKPFFVIGCEYVCRSPICIAGTSPDGRRFASTDTSILRALPPKLKDEFSAHLLQGNPDLGSGPEVWNWHGMGVSVALWNMVRASLKAGLRKDAIVDIIRAIQSGVPEDDAVQIVSEAVPGEEEEEEEEEEEDEEDDAAQVEGNLHFPKDATEEFNEAWNANSGAVGTDGVETEAGPSTVVGATESPAHPAISPDPNRPPQPPPQYAQYQPPYPPYAYAPYPYFHPPPMQHDPNAPNPNLLKRTFSIVDGSPDQNLSEPMQKRIRHCCKCGSNECKGKGGRAFCTNPCQDCGKFDCRGRNSKRPDRTCTDAWPAS
ncbi:uncharacterized protein FIBRA_04308 [Fibroporia radiculosa]|uniref:Post-SET domain-containing protein n=1 Tax=Fibroporia radiculosa TaxID=599839 RepID=J4G762_9APHY|nr:uncharacterized protein FIBRA_04308 [Fibroporia radiculosa]CCM02228.1 predicted protein [Fibroporia radiculosa]